MAKKKAHRRVARHHHSSVRTARTSENYLVVVRGWMLVVAFALMLGIGAVVGNFINQQLDQATPTVAGASIER
jgi:hypothetical protein